MVALTDLQNPSGVRLSDEDVACLDAIAQAHDLWLLVDETFRDASKRAPATLASHGSRWVTSGSLTKSFGLGGLRIGWVSGDEAVLQRCRETHNALSAQPSRPSLSLTRELLPHFGTLLERTHAILDVNRARWAASIDRGRGIFSASPSESTVTWCRFGGDGAGDAFASFADERFGVGVVPGSFFGDASGVRVSLGSEPRVFADAADAWDRAVAAFAATTATRESA
jgi:aspartate/methionine/tyrosine aminotransferase